MIDVANELMHLVGFAAYMKHFHLFHCMCSRSLYAEFHNSLLWPPSSYYIQAFRISDTVDITYVRGLITIDGSFIMKVSVSPTFLIVASIYRKNNNTQSSSRCIVATAKLVRFTTVYTLSPR